jgi:hypothetical protein
MSVSPNTRAKKTAWQRRWRRANPEAAKAMSLGWDAGHREFRRQRAKERMQRKRAENPHYARDLARAFRAANPNYVRESRARLAMRRAWAKWVAQCAASRARLAAVGE